MFKKIDLKRYKLRIRMAISNMLLAVVPLIVFSIITYGVFINDSNNLITSTLNISFAQMTERMEEYFGNVNTIIKTFAFDESVQDILKNDPNFNSPQSREKLENQLENIILLNTTISDAYVISNTQKVLSTVETPPSAMLSNLLNSAKTETGNAFLAVNDQDNVKRIAAVKMIRDVENLRELGYVIMMIDRNRLLNIFDTEIYGADLNFFIIDSSGNPVLKPDKNLNIPLYTIHKSMPEGTTTYTDSVSVDKKNYRFVIYNSAQTNWQLIATVSEQELYKRSLNVGYNILLYILIIVFLIVVLTTVTNFRITKPIARLADAIDRVASGDTKHKISFSEKNEITLIADNFNHMVDEVQAAKKRIFTTQQRLYETELQKKQFEVSLLQSQINSHFLYNTLSCIRAMSRKGAEQEVSTMITCLVGMLRYASNLQEKSVLQEEFTNVKNYVSIQNMRLGEQLQLLFVADDDILSNEIPKMTLQPVVENSILHGFDSNCDEWKIRIKAQQQKDAIYVSVIDNGSGIDKDKLKELNDMLSDTESPYTSSSKTGSIGLINIQNRIRSLYGEEYGVKVKSYKNIGTAVIIKIPLKRSDDYVFGTFNR